jgi:hypothetical protein
MGLHCLEKLLYLIPSCSGELAVRMHFACRLGTAIDVSLPERARVDS